MHNWMVNNILNSVIFGLVKVDVQPQLTGLLCIQHTRLNTMDIGTKENEGVQLIYNREFFNISIFKIFNRFEEENERMNNF